MNSVNFSADKAVLEAIKDLQKLNSKLQETVIQAEVIRVISRIEEILHLPIEHFIPKDKNAKSIVNNLVYLNFDNKTNQAKKAEAYQMLEDVRFLYSFDDKELIEYMYSKIEEYILWLFKIKKDNYLEVKNFFKIGESK